ncbi:hypothetical protein [Sediminitomix flava]|uniref:Lipoprotein n=1 Tax=Sediminitomix flava TaxID=379075 RepID=A0A315YPZ9_SEDFL|nr:hypothetical protein [Sediminitomix flava]PWJ29559.1 hypothetical protein BC781_1321 [Sediminitomix flava]
MRLATVVLLLIIVVSCKQQVNNKFEEDLYPYDSVAVSYYEPFKRNYAYEDKGIKPDCPFPNLFFIDSITTFKKGLKHGKEFRFSIEGCKISENTYFKGVLHGKQKFWEEGKGDFEVIYRVRNYVYGEEEGWEGDTSHEFLRTEGYYHKDKPFGIQIYYKGARIIGSMPSAEDDGPSEHVFSNILSYELASDIKISGDITRKEYIKAIQDAIIENKEIIKDYPNDEEYKDNLNALEVLLDSGVYNPKWLGENTCL